MTAAPEGAAHDHARPSARTAALEAVVRSLGGAYLSRALSGELDRARLDGYDRSLASDLAYGTVRRLLAIDARLTPYLERPDRLPPRVLAALRLGAYELLWRGTPAYAAVSAWVDVVKAMSQRHAALANAVLRRLAREAQAPGRTGAAAGTGTGEPADAEAAAGQGAGPGATAPAGAGYGRPAAAGLDPVRDLSLPGWLFERFAAALGREAAVRAALGMLEPEPLWLTALREDAEEALRAEGCEVRPGPELPLPEGGPAWPRSLSVRSPVPLARLRAFQEGLVQPQNPSSLFVARLLGARAGELVYDLASGQGVKTATLAASGARVVAVELSEKRAEGARRNLARLGLEAEHVVADLAAGWPGPDAPLGDRVLLDAPCSGTGTLRGHPEIKLRLAPEDVRRLAALQDDLLGAAARAVRPGGTLLYAVCSLTPDEGVERVEAFLGGTPGFAPLPLPEAPGVVLPASVGAYVLPVGGLDGFYLALLARAA